MRAYRDYADYAYTAFDLSNGALRSISEPNLDGDHEPRFTDAGAPYIATPYYGESALYPSSVALFIF